MSKKIILLALAVASLAAFALAASALAAEEDEALHVVPKPSGALKVDGEGEAILSGAFVNPIKCTASSGTAEFTTTTTGTFQQTFTGCKQGAVECEQTGQPKGTIKTEVLQFHLVTVVHEHNAAISGPGILVTPNAGVFAKFTCENANTVGGNGLVGTITKPKCGESSTEATVQFTSPSAGKQTHTTVLEKDTVTGATSTTPTNYSLTAFGFIPAAENASGIITLGGASKLECT